MRAPIALGLLVTLLVAGCVTPEFLNRNATAPLAIDPARVLAEDAAVEAVPEGVRVTWKLDLPPDGLKLDLGIPEGVTSVDARLAWPADAPGVRLLPREAGPMRRCAAFWDVSENALVCRGLTVLDPLPATWTFHLLSLGGDAFPITLEATLSSRALDGSAARIKLDALSKPTLALGETTTSLVESSLDGTRLFVEVTRPATDARVPTILISSPYNNEVRTAGGKPFHDAPYHTIPDYVPRGYAIAVADVRGFGLSEGCVDVWGPKEQQDQTDLIEWIAAQPWSDGKVAIFGQSYPGTTAAAGAVGASPHLAAAIIIAPVVDPYNDWHFGGVPNGESTGSPLGYQITGSEPPAGEGDPARLATLLAGSFCGTGETFAAANDPRALYTEFYKARNLSARAHEVKVPVLYTHGYLDPNVKVGLALDWFNALPAPKKGLFGPWGHRHPPRPDQDLLFHAWYDEWLKGINTGILDTPPAESLTLQGSWRGDAAWPSALAREWTLHLDAAAGALSETATPAASAQYLSAPARGVDDALAIATTVFPVSGPPSGIALSVDGLRFTLPPLDAPRALAGGAALDLALVVEGAHNTHVAAFLYEKRGEDLRLVTSGMKNAALRNSYEQYEPVPQGEPFPIRVPLQPTEWVLRPGSELVLLVRASFPSDWYSVSPSPASRVTVHTGEGASVLRFAAMDGPLEPAPWTAAVVAGPDAPS